MRSLCRGSFIFALLGYVVAIGCGGDSDTGTTGSGGAAGSGSPSSSSSSTSTSSTGGTGGGGSGCTEITVTDFKITSSQFYFGYQGTPNPMLGAADPDYFSLELYEMDPTMPTITGSVDLSTGDQANYKTCQTCVLVYQDVASDTGAPAKAFFQSSGKIDFGTTTAPYVSGSATDVTLVEVTVDPNDATSTPVPDGACLHLTSLQFNIMPPATGWTCPPEYYGDGQFCDCACGALDSDCMDATLPISGCRDGQTCSADGTKCEGVPTAWTCAADKYNGGAGNGCDCNCGTHDPDCDLMGETLVGCQAGETCNVNGDCLSPAWTCDPSYFGGKDGCDCGCGVVDVDCTDATVGSCDFCAAMGSCSTTDCPGMINATNNATCG